VKAAHASVNLRGYNNEQNIHHTTEYKKQYIEQGDYDSSMSTFSEIAAAQGVLGRFSGNAVMEIIKSFM
jgi:2,3-bisphosphoglycerate-independent phosphoglycerate mutase